MSKARLLTLPYEYKPGKWRVKVLINGRRINHSVTLIQADQIRHKYEAAFTANQRQSS
jgi:hypothetical protein